MMKQLADLAKNEQFQKQLKHQAKHIVRMMNHTRTPSRKHHGSGLITGALIAALAVSVVRLLTDEHDGDKG